MVYSQVIMCYGLQPGGSVMAYSQVVECYGLQPGTTVFSLTMCLV